MQFSFNGVVQTIVKMWGGGGNETSRDTVLLRIGVINSAVRNLVENIGPTLLSFSSDFCQRHE